MRKQAATELVSYMVKSGVIPDRDLEGCIDDIVYATRWNWDDGYEIGHNLKTRGWACDMNLAEELDGFGDILVRIVNAAEDLWAAENPHEPKFSEGDTVIWHGAPATVHGIYEYRPQRYKIRQGDMKPTSYYVVPFEDVSDGGEVRK
jgi:hypothetical protein